MSDIYMDIDIDEKQYMKRNVKSREKDKKKRKGQEEITRENRERILRENREKILRLKQQEVERQQEILRLQEVERQQEVLRQQEVSRKKQEELRRQREEEIRQREELRRQQQEEFRRQQQEELRRQQQEELRRQQEEFRRKREEEKRLQREEEERQLIEEKRQELERQYSEEPLEELEEKYSPVAPVTSNINLSESADIETSLINKYINGVFNIGKSVFGTIKKILPKTEVEKEEEKISQIISQTIISQQSQQFFAQIYNQPSQLPVQINFKNYIETIEKEINDLPISQLARTIENVNMDDNFKIESEIYKNFKPFLYQAISQINKEFRESTLDIIFESYNIPRTIVNDCKIVIGGGDAYEFYINTDKDSRSKVRFQTHDCDCRFITEGDTLRVLKKLKENRDSNSVMYQSDTNIEIYIKNLKEYAADRITNYLNLNISEPFITKVNDRIKQKYPSFSFVRDFNGKLFNKSGFSDKLLSSINYNYEYNFSRRPEALMDLFPYIPEPTNKFIPHFRPSDNDIMIDENMIGKLLDNNDLVYNGFIRYMASNEDRNIKEIQEDLYIFGLGYLVWDIVRMINWSLKNYDRINDRRNLNNKLDKYLKKYYDLIEAINNPEFYINCYSWKEFIRKCKNN